MRTVHFCREQEESCKEVLMALSLLVLLSLVLFVLLLVLVLLSLFVVLLDKPISVAEMRILWPL